MAGEQAWASYAQGRYSEAEASASAELTKTTEPADQQTLHGILAWCAYRRADYEKALVEIALAGDNQRALECHCYVAAYAKGHINDQKLVELVSRLPGNINAANALVVRAQTTESAIERKQVWSLAQGFVEQAEVAGYDASLANLLHNCGKYFLLKNPEQARLALCGRLTHRSTRPLRRDC